MLINSELPLNSLSLLSKRLLCLQSRFSEIGHAIDLVFTSNFLFKIYLLCLLLYEKVHSPSPITT